MSAEPDLTRILRDRQRDDDVRSEVARALGRIGAEARDGVQALAQILGDEQDDIDIRETAARALGAVGCRSRVAVSALQKALMDPDGDIRAAASRELARCREDKR